MERGGKSDIMKRNKKKSIVSYLVNFKIRREKFVLRVEFFMDCKLQCDGMI